ncbi:hypothetical protein DFH29DRAFT_1069674, partial [Suillus ampliporus]
RGHLLCIDCALQPSSSPSIFSLLREAFAYLRSRPLRLLSTNTYTPIEGFAAPDVPARIHHYSPDGRLFAYALPTVVRIFLADGTQLLQELSVPNIVELKFSPRGTYLSTWERPVKLEDGAQHKNLCVSRPPPARGSSPSHKSRRKTGSSVYDI